MKLLEKFQNFEVKPADRISSEDQTHLEHLADMYKRALNTYVKVYEIFRKEYLTYTNAEKEEFRYSNMIVGDFGTLKKIDELQDSYISRIFSYFSNKYKVSLENEFEKSDIESRYYRYGDEDPKELQVKVIDYNIVVDSIVDQLGGMNFQDKAVQELKEKLTEHCYNKYQDFWYVKVKGKKISFSNGYCSETWSGNRRYHSVEFLKTLLNALSYNTYGKVLHLYELERLYGYSWIDLTDEDFKNGFSCESVGVEKLKFFKNGKVDLDFKDAEFARNFVRDWCGYAAV